MNAKRATQSKPTDDSLGLRANTPETIRELIEMQLDRIDEAKRRIGAEGIVVRDMRGSVIPHPAIAIEAAATKLVNDLVMKWKRSSVLS